MQIKESSLFSQL